MSSSNCEFGMTNPKGYFRVGRREAALGVSGDRVPWGKMMGFTKAAEKWKTGMLIQAYERVELTGLWVHGVVERKEARVKLRILTGPEDAGGAAAGRENTGRGVGLGAEAGCYWQVAARPLSGAGKGLQVQFWRSRVPPDGRHRVGGQK